MRADEKSLERFCAGAYPRLVAALAHYCGDALLAEELAQEALVTVCRRWPQVSQLDSPVGWAYRVGVNHANSRFRRRRAERRARDRAVEAHRGVHHDPDGADRVAVRAALGGLTAKQRDVVVMRFFLGMSVDQVARLTSSSPGAVRGLTHRAMTALRDTLGITEHEEATDAS